MHILLTGASGRIGSYTLQYLLRHGHTVTSVDVTPLPPFIHSQLPKGQVEKHHVVDLASHTAVDNLFDTASSPSSSSSGGGGNIDGIIHFGSIPDPKGKDWRFVHNNNVAGSYNILYTAMKRGIKRVSQASSVNATGLSYTRPGKQVFDEFPMTEKETYRAVSPHPWRVGCNPQPSAFSLDRPSCDELKTDYDVGRCLCIVETVCHHLFVPLQIPPSRVPAPASIPSTEPYARFG